MKQNLTRLIAALALLALTLAPLAPAQASLASPRAGITVHVENPNVVLGEEVFLNGEGVNVARGTRFFIQQRTPTTGWTKVGKSWLGVKTGLHYRVFVGTTMPGTNYYRVMIPANKNHGVLKSRKVAVQVHA